MKSPSSPNILTRRSFLSRAVYTGVAAGSAAHAIRDLRLINSALAAQGSVSGYKALVCLFLEGGNDSNNWIVPTDTTTYEQYASIRGGLLTLPRSSLLDLTVNGQAFTHSDGRSYGLHPSCGKLQQLFDQGKLAGVLNVGTLVRPTTKAQYNSLPAFHRPPQLFSHSDQVTQWQTSIPDQPATTGWGGRVADLIDAVAHPKNLDGSNSNQISMSVSLNGANTFEVGNLISQYHVATTGAVTLSGNLLSGTGARLKAMRDILGLQHANLQRDAYAEVLDRAIATGSILTGAISETAQDSYWTTPFPTLDSVGVALTANSLSNQLKMIARLIQARGSDKFNMKRQIFFCSIGGFDTHTAQARITSGTGSGTDDVTNATGQHYKLLHQVSEAMYAFQKAMEQLGVANDVTTFTASDFSRTFPNNSQGSDHGWGAHQFIMGGAVNGGALYGNLQQLILNGPDDTGTGRWIPTLAVDQHAATLAKWFGVDPSMMSTIFPNLSRFSTPDLGFMT